MLNKIVVKFFNKKFKTERSKYSRYTRHRIYLLSLIKKPKSEPRKADLLADIQNIFPKSKLNICLAHVSGAQKHGKCQ